MYKPDQHLTIGELNACFHTFESLRIIVRNPWIWYACIFIWIVGVLGNLVNFIIFTRECMKKSFVNSLFCWLAMCDFLELVLLALFSILNGFSFANTVDAFVYSMYRDYHNEQLFEMKFHYLSFSRVLPLLSIHNISILMNITLAFSQYLLVVHPLKYKLLFSGNRTKRRILIVIFLLSFILSCLYLSSLLDLKVDSYIKVRFDETGNPHICARQGERFPPDEINDLITTVLESTRYNTSMPYEEVYFIYIQIRSQHDQGFISLLRGAIIRMGLLVILMGACISLIFGSIKARRIRQCFLDSIQTTNYHGSSINQITYKVTNQMIITTLVIVFIFLITEIPIAVSSFVSSPIDVALFLNSISGRTRYVAYGISTIDHHCSDLLTYLVSILILINLLISSSYTTFCYLIMSVKYRETLKSLLWNGYVFLKGFFVLPNIQCVRVMYHQTPTSDTSVSNERRV